MVATLGTGKALAGAAKLTGKATVVTFIDWSIGAIVRHTVKAVVPDILKRFKVVLHIGVFAIADEPPTSELGIRLFKVELVVRIHIFLHIQVETIGVLALVGDPFYQTEALGIELGKTAAQALARGAVKAETITGFLFPTHSGRLEVGNNSHGLLP